MDEVKNEELLDNFIDMLKRKRKGAQVFCVCCGAKKKTIKKWHNSYLCVECFKIMKNVGEDKFIEALKGKEE